ncbi:alpha-amylase family glycosyl hydrolase [Bacillus cihuensis]|uniref:alpha-amylase family glycosyl hydrolase n=1 Tax=Bacillus cihuensis TaxID=1208599 RepID=UPI00041C9EBC|nr:alpha-amylase family glycosyl hydrolase [Bacillus cihuensis]
MRKKAFSLILLLFLLIYALPAGAVEKEERTWQDESVYSLMIDRFNNGDTKNDKEVDVNDPLAYQGGDFAGIIEKLDYIKDMGFTAIMLTPIFDNEAFGYHGYWIKDFYNTDEHFGTIDEFKKLVAEAHKRDMKIILDFVVNHVGPNHPWVNDPKKQDWFHEKKGITNWNDQNQVETGWLHDLPDLNQDYPETRAYLLDAAKWWIQETDVDGYRLDTVKHVDKSFWNDFSKAVKEEKKDFYLIGEIWLDDPTVIASYQETGIDGFMDFSQNASMRDAFSKPDQSLNFVFTALDRNEKLFTHPEWNGKFIDNHDMTRFTHEIAANNENQETRWKLALTYMYTTPGIPIIYYGSEIAMNGGNDPDNRRFMGFKADPVLIDYITKLSEIRQQHPALMKGDLELLHVNDSTAVYKRTFQNETIIVAINNSSKSQTIDVDANKLGTDKELRGLVGYDLVRNNDGKYPIIIDREKAEIYTVSEKSGLNIPYLITMGVVIFAFVMFIVFILKRSKRNRSFK